MNVDFEVFNILVSSRVFSVAASNPSTNDNLSPPNGDNIFYNRLFSDTICTGETTFILGTDSV